MSSGQRRSCCSLPGLPHHPGEICFAADSLFSRDEWLSRPSHRPGAYPGGLRDRQHCPSRRDVPQDLVHALGFSISRGPRGDQPVQHPTDRTIVHTGGSHPSVRRDVRGIEAALWSLSQGTVPARVMFTPSSTQEECHGLGRPSSPLRGGLL